MAEKLFNYRCSIHGHNGCEVSEEKRRKSKRTSSKKRRQLGKKIVQNDEHRP